MGAWKKGRGPLGPIHPLIGRWTTLRQGEPAGAAPSCTRTFRALGKGWIELDARWEMGALGEYREIALFGAVAEGGLGFYSFTSDGKRSEGRRADGSDVHPEALAFEAEMPAGLARMIYWPLDEGPGFNFAVESRTKNGWNRFLRHEYRPAAAG